MESIVDVYKNFEKKIGETRIKCENSDCPENVNGKCLWRINENSISLAFDGSFNMCETLREGIKELCDEPKRVNIKDMYIKSCYSCANKRKRGQNYYCLKNNITVCYNNDIKILMDRLCEKYTHYSFLHKETPVIAEAWDSPEEVSVIAELQIGSSLLKLTIEKDKEDPILSLAVFLYKKQEGWQPEDYIEFDITDKIYDMHSWNEIEMYMQGILRMFCEKKKVDNEKKFASTVSAPHN